MRGIFGGLKNFPYYYSLGGVITHKNSDWILVKLNPGLQYQKRLRQAYDAIKKHMGLIVNVGVKH